MTATVKARYANGVFTPLEPVDLEEGAEVMVSMGRHTARVGGCGRGERSFPRAFDRRTARVRPRPRAGCPAR